MARTITHGNAGDTVTLEEFNSQTANGIDQFTNSKAYTTTNSAERINLNGRTLRVQSDEVLVCNGISSSDAATSTISRGGFSVSGTHTISGHGITAEPGSTVMFLGTGLTGAESMNQTVGNGVFDFTDATLIMTHENGSTDNIVFPSSFRVNNGSFTANDGTDINLTRTRVIGPATGNWILHGRGGSQDFARGGTFNGTNFSGNIIIQWTAEADWVNSVSPISGQLSTDPDPVIRAGRSNCFRVVNVRGNPAGHSRYLSFIDGTINWAPLQVTGANYARFELIDDQFPNSVDVLLIGDNSLFSNTNLDSIGLGDNAAVNTNFIRRMFAWNPSFVDANNVSTAVPDVRINFNLTGSNPDTDEAVFRANLAKNLSPNEIGNVYAAGAQSVRHMEGGYWMQVEAGTSGGPRDPANPQIVGSTSFVDRRVPANRAGRVGRLIPTARLNRTVNVWSYRYDLPNFGITTSHHRQSERGVFADGQVELVEAVANPYLDSDLDPTIVDAWIGNVATQNNFDGLYKRIRANWYQNSFNEDFNTIADTSVDGTFTLNRNILIGSAATDTQVLSNNINIQTANNVAIGTGSHFGTITNSAETSINGATVASGAFSADRILISNSDINGGNYNSTSTHATNAGISFTSAYTLDDATIVCANLISLQTGCGNGNTITSPRIDFSNGSTGSNLALQTTTINNWSVGAGVTHGTGLVISEITTGTGTTINITGVGTTNPTMTATDIFGTDAIPGIGNITLTANNPITIQRTNSRYVAGNNVTLEDSPVGAFDYVVQAADTSLNGFIAVRINDAAGTEVFSADRDLSTNNTPIAIPGATRATTDVINIWYKPLNSYQEGNFMAYQTFHQRLTFPRLTGNVTNNLPAVSWPSVLISQSQLHANLGTITTETKGTVSDALVIPIGGVGTQRLNGFRTQAVILRVTDTQEYINAMANNRVVNDIISFTNNSTTNMNFDYMTFTSTDLTTQQRIQGISQVGSSAVTSRNLTGINVVAVDFVGNPAGATIADITTGFNESTAATDTASVNQRIAWLIGDGTNVSQFKPNPNGRFRTTVDYTSNNANTNEDE